MPLDANLYPFPFPVPIADDVFFCPAPARPGIRLLRFLSPFSPVDFAVGGIHPHLRRHQHHHHRPTLSKVSWAEGKIYIWGSLTGPIIYYFPWSRSQVRVDFVIA